MADYNLSDLYNAAFGYVAKPIPTGLRGGAPTAMANRTDQLERQTIRRGKEGLYGTWIAMPVKLGDMELPNEPLVSITLAKLIVETSIDGNDGTFKENYSNGDYQVSIRGIVIDEDDPDGYPEDIMRQLREVIERRTHVPITCDLTTLFNITHLAIRGVEFPVKEGSLGAQPYIITASSDREFKLKYRRKE